MAELADAPGGGSLASRRSSRKMLQSNNYTRCGLFRRQRFDGQRMNVGLHQITDRRVHQAVSRDRRYAAESLGDDANSKMAVSLLGAGVSGMQVAFILYDQLRGREVAFQALAQALFSIGCRHR